MVSRASCKTSASPLAGRDMAYLHQKRWRYYYINELEMELHAVEQFGGELGEGGVVWSGVVKQCFG
jgi:hypothetical protein